MKRCSGTSEPSYNSAGSTGFTSIQANSVWQSMMANQRPASHSQASASNRTAPTRSTRTAWKASETSPNRQPADRCSAGSACATPSCSSPPPSSTTSWTNKGRSADWPPAAGSFGTLRQMRSSRKQGKPSHTLPPSTHSTPSWPSASSPTLPRQLASASYSSSMTPKKAPHAQATSS